MNPRSQDQGRSRPPSQRQPAPEVARALMVTNHRPPQVMVRGEGSWLEDSAGNRYLDFVQGWAVNSLGHCAPEVQSALRDQAARLMMPSPGYHNVPQHALCNELAEATGLDRVFLCNSGAEANECAFKLARKWGKLHQNGAHTIITTRGSFHGRTLAAMAASGKPGWDDMFPPAVPGFLKVPFGDLGCVERAVTKGTCAVMVEPIQGEAGVVMPPSGYLAGLRDLTRRAGILLILDEIQTGVGRTGTLFRFQTEDALPDILCLGKGLGGGMPLAAVATRLEAACFDVGEHGGTFSGNPIAAQCGLSVLRVISQPAFLAGVLEAGAAVEAQLSELAGRYPEIISHVRGAGLLWALTLQLPVANRLAQDCMDRGLLINAAQPDVLRLMPSLRLSAGETAMMGERLDSALSALREQIPGAAAQPD
jgi:acetylornithine/N-succinyldiaminopimelate aminotransferase